MRFLGAAVLCLTAVFSDGQLVENLLRTGLRYDSRDTSSLSYEGKNDYRAREFSADSRNSVEFFSILHKFEFIFW